jgi:hypothetical protein
MGSVFCMWTRCWQSGSTFASVCYFVSHHSPCLWGRQSLLPPWVASQRLIAFLLKLDKQWCLWIHEITWMYLQWSKLFQAKEFVDALHSGLPEACLGKVWDVTGLPRQAYGEVTSRAFWNPDGQFLNCLVTWCQAAKEHTMRCHKWYHHEGPWDIMGH